MFKQIKESWQNNELAVWNRRNKATFEALKMLYNDDLPWIFNTKLGVKQVKNWQGIKNLDFDYFCIEEGLSETAKILEPEEILKNKIN